ncbi:DUF1080 domain-containing protein [Sphingomonas sp. BK235]|uniref:3-keto-disaccharide hydrolase n=1 Tax=Sphingomonas sp. BK235 TaxID=2512131 RepID=UPI00104490D3|nr:DUF1080 domain-containing protein [Sphingomonas sp. BK235]TCP36644.1 uncharacterized protein DUF1080 [Sphingomonas sp. BK235]
MRRSITFALAMFALAAAPAPALAQEGPLNQLSAQERAAGWRLLFNGRDLTGWRAYGGGTPSPTWVVRDGALTLSAEGGAMSGSDLATVEEYGTFELTLDWKVERGGNSGVIYLSREAPGTTHSYETGLEMQVLDNDGHPDGKIPSHRAGALYDITVPPAAAAHPAGSWNHARLLVEPGRIRQWLNGTPTADVTFGDDTWKKRVAGSKFAKMPLFGTFRSGLIALQDHGEPVAYRNIKLRPLGKAKPR